MTGDPAVAAERARGRLPLADGHADALMWNRDLAARQRGGQVDLPRLREAGVLIQGFTVVTEGYPIIDGFGAFAALRGWPPAARRSAWSRCLFQLDALHALAARSGGALAVARSPADLAANLAAGRTSAVAGVEGAQALEGDAGRVHDLHARGVRFMGLVHLANNALGGCSVPLLGDRPLTPHGREVLDAMAASKVSVDLAHASRRTFADVLAHRAPGLRVMCSHTGIAGAHPSFRNLDDAQLRAIADRGGVTGVIFATFYLGGGALADVVRHVEHALRAAGEDAVALGSDFDGMVPMPPELHDVTGLPRLVEALARRVPAAVVEKVAFGNWRRYFGETL